MAFLTEGWAEGASTGRLSSEEALDRKVDARMRQDTTTRIPLLPQFHASLAAHRPVCRQDLIF